MNLVSFHTKTGTIKDSTGAGIIPIAKFQNKIYFLFGKEKFLENKNGWSDFGGKVETKESIIDAAIREGYEETSGFLGDLNTIQDLVYNKSLFTIDSDNYRSYVIQIKYNKELPTYFNNNFNFVSKNINKIVCKNGYYEKEKIRWFDIEDLKNNINLFRKFYQPFIKTIINNYQKILELVDN